MYNIVLVSHVQESDSIVYMVHTYFSSSFINCKMLNILPCAIQELCVVYLLHIVCVSEKAMAPHSSTLAGQSHGQRSLVGCRLWDHTESDTTEAT